MYYVILFCNAIGIALMAKYVYDNERRIKEISATHDQTGKALAVFSETISTMQNTKKEFLGDSSPIPSSKVAFHAKLVHSITLGERQSVIFDHVITNAGKAYNQHTGHFTAPLDGTYFFACTFLSDGSTRLHLQMFLNSSEISKGHARSGEAASGSMNAVIYLNKGDVVNVRHFPGQGSQTIHGDWSYFTGYLL
ncbi:heavy metal-binding protein HIP-like isoform X2 [Mytilus trossulus]|uniref:heavy metal-binding protein HIP-like isoform X2 n=1 Tax=Mytilus trossulus TaxID=6551 RepID=UPI0030058191